MNYHRLQIDSACDLEITVRDGVARLSFVPGHASSPGGRIGGYGGSGGAGGSFYPLPGGTISEGETLRICVTPPRQRCPVMGGTCPVMGGPCNASGNMCRYCRYNRLRYYGEGGMCISEGGMGIGSSDKGMGIGGGEMGVGGGGNWGNGGYGGRG